MVAAASPPAHSDEARAKQPTPVIFVHGNSGSAQQFETNAMRLTSNGFPQNRIFAYEYDTAARTTTLAIADLDGFIADVKAQTGAEQVDVLAHSRGTTVMHAYLGDPERAAVGSQLRQLRRPDERGRARRRPDAGGLGRGRPDARDRRRRERLLPEQGPHRGDDVGEAFEEVYEFLLGEEPETTGRPGEAEEGHGQGPRPRLPRQHRDRRRHAARLRARRRDRAAGQGAAGLREADRRAGNFGRLNVNGKRHYEFEISQAGESTIHNYPEPFERDDHFYRVLTAPLLDPFIERSPDTSRSPSPGCASSGATRTLRRGRQRQAPVRRLQRDQRGDRAAGAARAGGLQLRQELRRRHRHERVAAAVQLDRLPHRRRQLHAREPGRQRLNRGQVRRCAIPIRRSQTMNVPDWPSDLHTVSVYFKDYDAKAYKK